MNLLIYFIENCHCLSTCPHFLDQYCFLFLKSHFMLLAKKDQQSDILLNECNSLIHQFKLSINIRNCHECQSRYSFRIMNRYWWEISCIDEISFKIFKFLKIHKFHHFHQMYIILMIFIHARFDTEIQNIWIQYILRFILNIWILNINIDLLRIFGVRRILHIRYNEIFYMRDSFCKIIIMNWKLAIDRITSIINDPWFNKNSHQNLSVYIENIYYNFIIDCLISQMKIDNLMYSGASNFVEFCISWNHDNIIEERNIFSSFWNSFHFLCKYIFIITGKSKANFSILICQFNILNLAWAFAFKDASSWWVLFSTSSSNRWRYHKSDEYPRRCW